jgi:hypothetical protein
VGRPKLQVGDVVAIPLGDGRFGVAQAAAKYLKDGFSFQIFNALFPSLPSEQQAREALDSGVRLAGLSLDALVYHGRWPIVARQRPRHVGLTVYREVRGTPDNVFLVDFHGSRARPITPEEELAVPYRTTVAPIRLQNALRADAGLIEWDDSFNKLRPPTLTTESTFDA